MSMVALCVMENLTSQIHPVQIRLLDNFRGRGLQLILYCYRLYSEATNEETLGSFLVSLRRAFTVVVLLYKFILHLKYLLSLSIVLRCRC